jgi:hypothetical protein
MSKLTVYLARFIGLFALLAGVGCLVRGNEVVKRAVANGPVMLSGQPRSWSRDDTWAQWLVRQHVTSAVTVVGWLMLAKGLLLFFVGPKR